MPRLISTIKRYTFVEQYHHMRLQNYYKPLILVLLASIGSPAYARPQKHGRNKAQTARVERWEVDDEPSFPGGEGALVRFINNKRLYPEDAYQRGISGRVLCSFVIAEDGHINDVKVVRGVEKSLDEEAVRIIMAMPAWRPAHADGEAVSVTYFLPIAFRL